MQRGRHLPTRAHHPPGDNRAHHTQPDDRQQHGTLEAIKRRRHQQTLVPHAVTPPKSPINSPASAALLADGKSPDSCVLMTRMTYQRLDYPGIMMTETGVRVYLPVTPARTSRQTSTQQPMQPATRHARTLPCHASPDSTSATSRNMSFASGRRCNSLLHDSCKAVSNRWLADEINPTTVERIRPLFIVAGITDVERCAAYRARHGNSLPRATRCHLCPSSTSTCVGF